MDGSGKIERLNVPALDEILGIPFRVLNDGFVRLIDYMGSDGSIVQAARVSYGKGTKKVHQDRGLIRYLMRHHHTTPFEMCEIKLHVRVPMDCWRQWIRHRTASVNEYSTRYSEAIDSAQLTDERPVAGAIRGQPPGQQGIPGSGGGLGAFRKGSGIDSEQPPALPVSASRPGLPGSRLARTFRSQPIPRPTGRSTSTICCIS